MARLVLGNKWARASKERPWLHRILWWTEAMLISAGLGLSGLLPLDWASAMGRRLMTAIGPRLGKHKKFKEILQISFPEKSAEELEQLVIAVWGNVGAVMAEYSHLKTICVRQADERIEIETQSSTREYRTGQRPAIFVAAHLSNFEVCAGAIRKVAGPVTLVYKPLKNPWLDERLAKYRQSMGCDLISSEEGAGALLRELRAGRSIGLVMDQRHSAGKPIPFLGVLKPTTLVPARLALRCGVDLIPVRAERLEGSRFRITFYDRISPGDPEEPDTERALGMTHAVNRLFEQWIHACPHDWLPMRLAKATDERSRGPSGASRASNGMPATTKRQ
jgi:KDO2-lipid IV(A) lauroyltransferase